MKKYALGLALLSLVGSGEMVAGTDFNEAIIESRSELKTTYIKRLKFLELWFITYFASLKGKVSGTASPCSTLADHTQFLVEDMIAADSDLKLAKKAIEEIKKELKRKNPEGPEKARKDFDLLKEYNEKLFAKINAKGIAEKMGGDWVQFANPENIGGFEAATTV